MTPAVLVGQAIGDALGMPFEKLRDEVHPGLATWEGEFQAGTFHKLPAGHYTDDTEMAICLAESLLHSAAMPLEKDGRKLRGYDPEDAAKRYVKWIQGTPHGAGGTTKKALAKLVAGTHTWRDSGEIFVGGPDTVGAAPPMRASPFGVYFHRSVDNMQNATKWDAMITHRDTEAWMSSFAVALAVKFALDGARGAALLETVVDHMGPPFMFTSRTYERLLHSLTWLRRMNATPQELVESGVLGRFGNAWQIACTAIYTTAFYSQSAWVNAEFKFGVPAAVRLGGDADTRGAVTGAILGALVGLEGIPDQYKTVKDFEMLRDLDAQLWEKRIETLVPCGTCHVKWREMQQLEKRAPGLAPKIVINH